MKRLGINIDHIATVRNARGSYHPDPLTAAKFAMKCGADSITIHLREDRRHIKDIDVVKIQETHPNCPVHIYAADHGFNCDMRSQYNSYAAHVSGMRTIILFEQNLAQG